MGITINKSSFEQPSKSDPEIDFVNGVPSVRLRAFRAIHEPETCQKFIEGHKHVLVNFGIEMITSARNDWVENPGTFVLVVESLDGGKVFGGMRLQLANGLFPLPIETAVGYMDEKIYEVIREHAADVTGESCGLWNSRLIAGYGIGSVFLSRAGASLAALLGVKSLFSLCAPYTVQLAQNMGMHIMTHLGKDGTFYYPKLDLLATVLIHEDLNEAKTADDISRQAILELIKRPREVRLEKLRRKEIEIHYELDIQDVGPQNIKSIIQSKY